METIPDDAVKKEVKIRIKVVFPAPFLPNSPTMSPLFISKETLSNALDEPKFLLICLTINNESAFPNID